MFSNKFWQIVVAFFLFGQIAFCNDPKELKIGTFGYSLLLSDNFSTNMKFSSNI